MIPKRSKRDFKASTHRITLRRTEISDIFNSQLQILNSILTRWCRLPQELLSTAMRPLESSKSVHQHLVFVWATARLQHCYVGYLHVTSSWNELRGCVNLTPDSPVTLLLITIQLARSARLQYPALSHLHFYSQIHKSILSIYFL